MSERCRAWLRLVSKLLWVVSVGFGLLGCVLYVSWASDAELLLEVAQRESSSSTSSAERIQALNQFVYNNQGFAKNDRYFLLSRLGPTPIQVLELGGDCADKSRLLSALLNAIAIDSTLAMLYACETCPAVHTVVEARYSGDSVAVDPVYGVDFPAPDGGFLGIRELSADHGLVVDRIEELRELRGPLDKINGYDYDTHSYRVVRTVNWTKNWMTRAVGGFLGLIGHDPFLVRRPQLLEDPKLILFLTGLLASAALLFVGAICRAAGT